MNELVRIGSLLRIGVVVGATLVGATVAAGCSSNGLDAGASASTADLSVASSFIARGTGYYPDSSALEGGFKDRRGKPLYTLQQFLAGTAPYAAVAMDTSAFSYGTRLRIHELESKYGQSITFRVVDTGGAFVGKGKSRIDICTANNKASLDPTINGTLHIDALDESSGPSDPTDNGSSDNTDGSGATSSSSSSGSSSTTSGIACSGDGTCNPGSNGSGMICSGGHCIPGCHSDAQCPGSLTYDDTGQCS